MIIKDLQYLKDVRLDSKVRGGNLRSFSFNSTLFGENKPFNNSVNWFSLANNPDDPLRWRLPDLTSGRVMPIW